MDGIISILLPMGIVVIMFSLGLGLDVADFARIARYPKAFLIGAVTQLVGLPACAYFVAMLFGLPPELALGFMILSFCPSGASSNLMTKVARGDVALSISLVGCISLISVFTVPPLVVFFADHFLGLDAPDVDITSLGVSMFLLTIVPVIAGIFMHRHFAGLTRTIEPFVGRLAIGLLVILVAGALVANWSLFVETFAALGPSVVVLLCLLLALGLLLARLFGLDQSQSTAIALETSVQNAALGITIGSLLVEQAGALPAFSLPSGVYAFTMYLIAIPFALWRRRLSTAPAAQAAE